MYKIYQGTKLIGITEDDKYVKRGRDGALIPCEKADADGMMFLGTYYDKATATKAHDLSVSEIASEIPAGTKVEANPTGTASTDLTKLKVGSTIYGIPEDVEANPTGDATVQLTKIKIGSVIYSLTALSEG